MVEVQCHTAPFVSFMSRTLANHSYVDISQVWSDASSDTVQCYTDLSTCCSGAQGPHQGDWYFPEGNRLPLPDIHILPPIYESRQAQTVHLHRNSGIGPTGIYRCDIETIAGVSGNGMRETVYVGLYLSDEGKYNVIIKENPFFQTVLKYLCFSSN